MSSQRRLDALVSHCNHAHASQRPVALTTTSGQQQGEYGGLPSGGKNAARALAEQRVNTVFTLTGGHIAPILVGCSGIGIRVIDVRDEATAVFAADGMARMSGIPGVAIVTAGPGLTNTITAIKNAQLAESAVVVLCGATSLLLKGRGSLQDIDQMALVRPHVKFCTTITRVKDIIPILRKAFDIAASGVPGPVVVEFPLDTIWPEVVIEETMDKDEDVAFPPTSITDFKKWATNKYLERYRHNLFNGAYDSVEPHIRRISRPLFSSAVGKSLPNVIRALKESASPVILIGSQCMSHTEPDLIQELCQSLDIIGVPVYLSGMARGLLGKEHPLQFRHKRSATFRSSDFVLLAGASADFRVDYGRQIPSKAYFCMVNLSPTTLKKNSDLRGRSAAIQADSHFFLMQLAHTLSSAGDGLNDARRRWRDWIGVLRQKEAKRDAEIIDFGKTRVKGFVNPVVLCAEVNNAMETDSVVVADGGDFVGTASYIVKPSKPLSWLDPGVFGTLGVGGGFAIAAKAFRPKSEVWILFGDGACGWSLCEIDTMVRCGLPPIIVVGNDACWMQMHRDQTRVLGDDVATVLAYTRYDEVAKGFGAHGILIRSEDEVIPALNEAKRIVREENRPVLINAFLFRSNFREGSISL